jgi:hypothetical protein
VRECALGALEELIRRDEEAAGAVLMQGGNTVALLDRWATPIAVAAAAAAGKHAPRFISWIGRSMEAAATSRMRAALLSAIARGLAPEGGASWAEVAADTLALLAPGLLREAAQEERIIRSTAAFLGRVTAELRRASSSGDATALREALRGAHKVSYIATRLAGCPDAADPDGSLVRALLSAALLQLPDCTAEASDVLRLWQCKAHAAAGLRLLVAGALLDASSGATRLTGAGAWDEVLRAAPSLLRQSMRELATHRRGRQEEGCGGAVVGDGNTSSLCSGSGSTSGGGNGSSSTGSSTGSGDHSADSPDSIADKTAHAAHETCAAVCSAVALILLVDAQEPEGSSSSGSSSCCAGPPPAQDLWRS